MAALHGVSSMFLCALIALRSSTVSGLTFGNTTLVTEYAAFQELGSVMEAYCTAPQGSDSTMLYFVLGSSEQHYSAAATPEHVSIVDSVTAKFTWRFPDTGDLSTPLYCEVQNKSDEMPSIRGQNMLKIYVSKVPSLSRNPLKCVVNMTWTSKDSGIGKVQCELQRSLHTRHYTGVHYTLYLVNRTGNEVEDKFLWSMPDDNPTNEDHSPLPLEFSIESSTVAKTDYVLLKIVFFEKYFNRTITVLQRLNLLGSLNLPSDTLIWQPLSNGTGFFVTVHPGLLSPMCGSRAYTAKLNVSSATDDKYMEQSFTLRCNPCVDGKNMCSAVIGDLAPAQQYSVVMRQHLHDTTDAELRFGELLPHVQETSVFTEEIAPLEGPELHPFYQVMDCDETSAACRSSHSCVSALKDGACQMVRIFWKAIPKSQRNGKIRFYVLHIAKKWHDLVEETVNLTGQAKMAEIYRHPSQRLSIILAGGTSKGLPPVTLWSTGTIPSHEAVPDNQLPSHIMLSRRSAVEGPCNISWFTEASAAVDVAAQNATLFYCSSDAPSCQDYTFLSIRAERTAHGGWLPLERFLWSSDQLANGNDFLCREGTLALAIVTSTTNTNSFMTRLETVDCRAATGKNENSAAVKITSSDSDSEGMCLKWLPPFPVACDTAPGRVVLLNLSLFSRDGGRMLEQQVLDGSTTDHCFSRNKVEDAETYYASFTWAADIGLPEPYFIGPAEVMLNAPGLTIAAKSGVALAAAVFTALVGICLAGCSQKARVYQKTWRTNLTIPKIKMIASQDCGQLTSSNLVHNDTVMTDPKCIYYEISRALTEQPSGRLRKWSSKDSAFASQYSSSPPVDNDQSNLLNIGGQIKEIESNADVAGEVYTTLGALLHADLSMDTSGVLGCQQRIQTKQSQRLHSDDKDSVTHCLSDEESPLLIGCVSVCANGFHQVCVPGGFKADCPREYKFFDGDSNQFCGSVPDLHGRPYSSDATIWSSSCRYAGSILRGHRDNSSVASYTYAAADMPGSPSSDYLPGSILQASGNDNAPCFRCLECEGATRPTAMDYITVSDAIRIATT